MNINELMMTWVIWGLLVTRGFPSMKGMNSSNKPAHGTNDVLQQSRDMLDATHVKYAECRFVGI